MRPKKIKIVHIITGLSTGGAEMMLLKLLSKTDKNQYDVQVISLTNNGPIGEKISQLGINVHIIGMKRGIPNPIVIIKLIKLLNLFKPDIIQTWMYHSDLLGGLAAKIYKRKLPVIWNIRHSNLDKKYNKRSTILVAKVCSYLSRLIPEKIICCSEEAMSKHVQLGYIHKKFIVIPNGFELESFYPDKNKRLEIRKELGINDDDILIGLIGRFDPLKDHHNFFEAVKVLSLNKRIYFLLCGDQIDKNNSIIINHLSKININGQFFLLGRRDDIDRINCGLDISTSSSYGEGFSNVIGESMASGVPCVVTNVGDSALIVGDTGKIVPSKDPAALAKAWVELIMLSPLERKELGLLARERIKMHFDITIICDKYYSVYKQVYKTFQY